MVGLYCCALLSVFKICCKSALRRFFVEAWQVVSCALHHLDHLVETHAVASVGEVCIRVGVECTGGGEGVALDTRNLHKAAHRGRTSVRGGVRVPSRLHIQFAIRCRQTAGRQRLLPWRMPRPLLLDIPLPHQILMRWFWQRCRRVRRWQEPAQCARR